MKCGRRASVFLDEADGIGGDAFFATREAELLGGSGLDAHLVWLTANDIGQTGLHGRDMRVQFGTLGTDCGVDIAHAIAFLGEQGDGLTQEYLAVDAVGLGSSVWEMVADVAKCCSAE